MHFRVPFGVREDADPTTGYIVLLASVAAVLICLLFSICCRPRGRNQGVYERLVDIEG
jgi:hypothetical protein